MNVCMYMRPMCEQDSLCPYMYICVHLSAHIGTECVCVYVSVYLCVCWGYFLPFSVSLSHSQAASPTHAIHINIPAFISTCVFHSLPCLWRGGRGTLTHSPGDWCWIPVLLPAT